MRSAQGDSKGSHVKFKKYVPHVLIVLLAVGIVVILWLTLFSRLGNYTRHFYPPFSSYTAVKNGSSRALLEIVGNIVLFIPIGVISALFLRLNIKRSLLVGFTISLIIECCQWFFWLGSFEFDDLIHNTIGSGAGAALVVHTSLGEKLKLRNRKKSLVALAALVVLIILSSFTYQGLKWQEMKRLAALNDRKDGTKNLLVLNPDPKYIGETDFSVAYQSDGSILIEGSSKNRAWIEIGRVTLEPGKYSFSGLSEVKDKTIDLELHYFDKQDNSFYKFIQDVGVVNKKTFEITESRTFHVLIGIFPNTDGSYIARPSIYLED